MIQALNEMKTGPSDVSLVLFAPCDEIEEMTESFLRFLDGLGMLAEWALIIVMPFFKGKVDIRNCFQYRL